MRRRLGATALLFFLSLSADANPRPVPVSQDPPLCGVCLELDNETLPDKHYFPPSEEMSAPDGAPLAAVEPDDALGISARIWTTESAHMVPDAYARVALSAGTAQNKPAVRHGEPSSDPADLYSSSWAWGGIRECSRGPEGKIAAGCHAAHYDNLLCNSHYDECDDELFALAVSAVRNADVQMLRDLLGHSGRSTVVLNRKRAAIQLVGCSGNIVGHLPLESSLLRALQ